jgi:GT2 family glycosyltransferase
MISILVLNWNGEAIIEECINSLFESVYTNYEIVVVDNASTDSSITILKKYSNKIKLIIAEKNLGYAAGNNLGFKNCSGEYIITLNNDIIVDKYWLNNVTELFEQNQSIGIISCRQMSYFNREIVDALFSYPTTHLLLGRMNYGLKYNSDAFDSKPGFVIGANGASAIYRKKFLDDVGGFEESFFAYQEENDLHMRGFYNGWKCLYKPDSVVYHKGGYSFNKVKKTFYYYHERNRIWFIYRCFPLSIILRYLPIILLRELRTMINMILIRGMVFTYIKCRIDGFFGMVKFKDIRKGNMAKSKDKMVLLKKLFKIKKI